MTGFVPWLPVAAAPRGQRLAVKDVIDVAGLPTGAGHPRWLATHDCAARDADVVDRLRAGFTVIGKTHTDELAYSLAGTNRHYGTPDNPAAAGRVPGGSSSGSAVAVAAGAADLGLGTDTAGSIRVPASYTGLFGLRPTHGRVSGTGIVPLAPSFDVPGLLTRDLATLRAATALLWRDGDEAELPRRLWIPADLPISPEARSAMRPAVDRLAAELALETGPLFDPGGWDVLRAAFTTVQAAEAWSSHSAWIRGERPEFGPGVTARFAYAAEVTGGLEAAARSVLRASAGRLLRGLGPDGVLVLPATPAPAPVVGAAGADRAAIVRLTCLAPVAGAPALSVPAAKVDGLPFGVCLLAAPGRDESLLATAEVLS
ncbi:amidase family protein [Nocardia abscessus]|uniref:amidase family protein n=1 Tax=Nocardia abscessus TaxID=120957 RepID=UPI002453AB3E|nr:amidase family protein [Nocardia abscessus]